MVLCEVQGVAMGWGSCGVPLAPLSPWGDDVFAPQRPVTSPWLSPGSLCGLQ